MSEKIRLYGNWRSGASHRVRIALVLKQLDWEEIPVDLMAGEQFTGDIAAHNPSHAVPMLIDGGPPLTQSLAIIEYLDETYPQPPLFPQAPDTRAAARSFALITIADAHPFQVTRVRNHLATACGIDEAGFKSWSQHWQTLALQAMEKRLAALPRDTAFCFGGQPGIADIALASHMASAKVFETPTEAYPRVTAINQRCLEMEAFSATSPQALKPAGLT